MVLGAETVAFSLHFLRADWELLNASLCFLKENLYNILENGYTRYTIRLINSQCHLP